MTALAVEGPILAEASGFKKALNHKVFGKIPVWVFLVIGIAAAGLGYRWYASRTAAATAAAAASGSATDPSGLGDDDTGVGEGDTGDEDDTDLTGLDGTDLGDEVSQLITDTDAAQAAAGDAAAAATDADSQATAAAASAATAATAAATPQIISYNDVVTGQDVVVPVAGTTLSTLADTVAAGKGLTADQYAEATAATGATGGSVLTTSSGQTITSVADVPHQTVQNAVYQAIDQQVITTANAAGESSLGATVAAQQDKVTELQQEGADAATIAAAQKKLAAENKKASAADAKIKRA